MRLVSMVVLLALVMGGCVYSSNDRASEIANATPTTVPTADPDAGEPTDPAVDPDATPGDADAPQPTPGSTPGWVVVENVAAALNVRAGAGTDNPVLTQAPLGTTLATTGAQSDVEGAIWVEVETEDGTGWVHGDFVAPTVEPTPTPIATPTPLATPTPQASGDNLVVDAPKGLRLRSGPSSDATVIRTIEDGSVVIPTGATTEDDNGTEWVEIRDGADTGWVAAEFLRSP